MEAFKIRMDQINFEISKELSPRDSAAYGRRGRRERMTEHVAHLVDAIRSGVVLPPIALHRGSMAIVDGVNRFIAFRHFAGDEWATFEIGAVWDEDCPDPIADPLGFTLLSAQYNASHGLSLSDPERKSLIQSVMDALGPGGVERAAAALNMTADACRILVPALQRIDDAVSRARSSTAKRGETTRTALPHPHSQSDQVQPREFMAYRTAFRRGLHLIIEAVEQDGYMPHPEDKVTLDLVEQCMSALKSVMLNVKRGA